MRQQTGEIVHASNARGYAACGETRPGRTQANVEIYPERWETVTCEDCRAIRS